MRTTCTSTSIAYKAVTAALSGAMALGAMAQPAVAFAANTASSGTVSTTQDSDLDLPEQRLINEDADDKTQGGESTKPWKRLYGDSRYDTMAAIAREGWLARDPYAGGSMSVADWAIVATGDNYPDALSASALAGVSGGAPVILTASDHLSTQAKQVLEDLKIRRVYLMGGTGALGKAVENAISNMDITTTRIEGSDRVATSIEALKTLRSQMWESLNTIMVATGYGYADALSAGPLAYRNNIPIVLTNQDGKLSDTAVEAIKGISSIRKVILVGGPSVVSNEVQDQLGMDYNIVRIAGQNRYETSAKLALAMTEGESGKGSASYNHTWMHPVVATGEDFPDALAGAALAGKMNSVLLLADSSSNETVALLKKEAKNAYIPGQSYLLGGTNAISNDLADILSAIPTN